MGIFPAADIGAVQTSAVLTLLVRGNVVRFGEMSVNHQFWGDSRVLVLPQNYLDFSLSFGLSFSIYRMRVTV